MAMVFQGEGNVWGKRKESKNEKIDVRRKV